MDAEAAIVEKAIGCGLYQFWHFLLFQWVTILQACNIAFMVFGKYSPPINCEMKCSMESGKDLETMENSSDGKEIERCANQSVVQFYSIAVEWHLYCSNQKIPYLILTTQMLGVLIGSLVFGQLSDFYGRRKILLASLLGQLACGTASSFSTSWRMFTVFRFFIGFFGGGTHTTNQVYFAEVVNARHRLWLSNAGGWPLSLGVFSFVAWITGEWRALTLYSNLMCAPTLFLLWKLDESPRWRLRNGSAVKAGRTLRKFVRARKWCGIEEERVEEELRTLDELVSVAEKSSVQLTMSEFKEGRSLDRDYDEKIRYSYLDLFSTSAMRKYALVVALTHLASSCIAHGIMFHADALSGDIYVNLFLLSIFRWLTNILTIVADTFFQYGRKVIYVFPCLAISLCSIIIVLMGNVAEGGTTVTALALTSAALSSPLWISTLLWPAELFPTPVRNLASSFGAMFDRLGGVMIPQILLLSKPWPPAPYAVFALLAITSAATVAYVLPETKGRPLPERMPGQNGTNAFEQEELEKFVSNTTKASPL